jgi:imidazolonepropionase-like amidohydrolase
MHIRSYIFSFVIALACTWTAQAQLAVRGEIVHTMAGPPIAHGVVLIRDGKIEAVGTADAIAIPEDYTVLEAAVVTPGLIDAHGTVGLSGILNQPHDQDQIETSSPIQPELRAIDAYNVREELIEWVRSFGVTTVHTGHAPGELISGQTMIVKTVGNTVDEAMLVETAAVAATLGPMAQRREGSPGTRGKMMSLIRSELIKAQEYRDKRRPAPEPDDVNDDAQAENDSDDEANDSDRRSKSLSRDLRLETLVRVLDREIPLLITVHRAQDIANALRLANEFEIDLWIDGAAEAYLLINEIKAAGVSVLIHPSMARMTGELENASFETVARLQHAGIPVAMQSGYEQYVPKTRVVLFEAAIAAANGLTFEQALALITRDAAAILGIADRVGTLQPGLDADLALFDGDPFEYTTHCIGVIINGIQVSDVVR